MTDIFQADRAEIVELQNKLEAEIERLREIDDKKWTEHLIEREDLKLALIKATAEKAQLQAENERLQHNQITADSATLARVAALQAQEADAATRYANAQAQRAQALEIKLEQFTDAILKSMTLIDELMRENARLCAASNDPPDIKLFAAKNSFDQAMHKLLGEEAT